MRCIHQNLHSKRGVSAIIALVFLLFCATVGAIVLTAASANAGKSTRVQKEQQAYFAVRSAAQLVRDKLEGTVFCGTFEEITACSGDCETAKTYVQDPQLQYPDAKNHWNEDLKKTASAWIEADAKGIFELAIGKMTSYGLEKQAFDVNLELSSIPKVKATYQMDEKYNITFTFETSGGNTSVQKVTLTIPADEKTTISSWKKEWMEYKMGIGEDGTPIVVDVIPQYAIIQRTETTVTWNRGVLTKGIDDTSDGSGVPNP